MEDTFAEFLRAALRESESIEFNYDFDAKCMKNMRITIDGRTHEYEPREVLLMVIEALEKGRDVK